MTAKQGAFLTAGGVTYSSELCEDESAPKGIRSAVNASLKEFRDSLDLLHSQALHAAEVAPGHLKDYKEGFADGMYRALKLYLSLFKERK